jgi:hypothetical protein
MDRSSELITLEIASIEEKNLQVKVPSVHTLDK